MVMLKKPGELVRASAVKATLSMAATACESKPALQSALCLPVQQPACGAFSAATRCACGSKGTRVWNASHQRLGIEAEGRAGHNSIRGKVGKGVQGGVDRQECSPCTCLC